MCFVVVVARVADASLPGLQYAKTYTGRNGCDTEIVIELTPKPGIQVFELLNMLTLKFRQSG